MPTGRRPVDDTPITTAFSRRILALRFDQRASPNSRIRCREAGADYPGAGKTTDAL